MTQFDRASKISRRPFDHFFDFLSNRIYINFKSWPKLGSRNGVFLLVSASVTSQTCRCRLLTLLSYGETQANVIKTTFLIYFEVSSRQMGPKKQNEQCAGKTKCVDRSNSLKSGFVKGDSRNLPKVDSLMVFSFMSNDSRFVSASTRDGKIQRAARESYGDSAIGWIQLKEDGNLTTVIGRISPEHKVTSTAYEVQVVINTYQEEIIDASCFSCAASLGGCKHLIAFIFWLHRRSEEAAPTEVISYWNKAKLSSVGTTIKFIEVKEFKESKQVISNILIVSYCYIHALSIFTFQSRSTNNATCIVENFLDEVIKMGSDKNAAGELYAHFNGYEAPTDNLRLHILMQMFKDEGKASASDFIKFCKYNMTQEACQKASICTVDQSDNRDWFELRYGRITASRFHEAASCTTYDGTLVQVGLNFICF